ncbi:MAG: ATP-grasp domain-containing protein, partial [Deltaproteobacteria bacterium]|nr:ATP-grasp domain-containing protein [Deltaproteobacteria bacterium]
MFKKVLIANRGEIALRIIRSCKELGIPTVAVHSKADEHALFVKLADESVCIGPSKATDSYLLPQRILSAAEITGADAIHPGYGFLAENAEFAKQVVSCGFTFIGPSPENIELMGDKLASREVMQKYGLTLLPSATISDDNLADAEKELDRIGLPLIVKASAGGGGKGIKIVRSKEDFLNTVRNAQSEAKAAFGDGRVYLEKYLESARHIEFQIAADQYGNVVHLGERDCSIQRRYQKVVEETPSPAVPTELRDRVGAMVVDAVTQLGYQSVGTVEFLMDRDKNFYFLEMNTRIQVEHPITEEVTNIDLVKLQIK